jgi:hypothetical protein
MDDPHFSELSPIEVAKLLSETWGCPDSFRIVQVTRLNIDGSAKLPEIPPEVY